MSIEYNKWCKQCKSYKLDSTAGILCGLTDRKPIFTDSCKDFILDEERIQFSEYKEKEILRRKKIKEETGRTIFYEYLYEKKILLPLFIILSCVSIYYFDPSEAKSIVLTIFSILFTTMLILRTKYIPKNIRYIYIENNRVKNMFGPGLVTFPSFTKYKKIELDYIASDLINEKYREFNS
jgi:hypothetical protein